MAVFLPGGGSKAASDQDSVFYSNTVDEDGAVKLSVGSASDRGRVSAMLYLRVANLLSPQQQSTATILSAT